MILKINARVERFFKNLQSHKSFISLSKQKDNILDIIELFLYKNNVYIINRNISYFDHRKIINL